jgi:DnaJ-class molecular chaperone
MYSHYNKMNQDRNRINGKTDFYDILGVTKDATQEEIKKAYRKLSLQLHPDRNNNSQESTQKYQEINSAYEVLSSEQERASYDRQRNSPFSNAGGHAYMEVNPSDIFNFLNKNVFEQMGAMNMGQMNMGGGMSFGPMGMNIGGINLGDMTMDGIKSKLMKPVPIIKTEEIQLSKAYNGCKLPVNIKRWLVENGVKREETETVYIQVPKGVDDNELIILRGKGNSLSHNNFGDVKVFIKIINDTGFIRNGLDLTLNKTITLKEALCGFSFDLKYIDGRTFKINNGVGNIITNNYNKVINKMGLTRDEHVGNLIINFTVDFPTDLTPQQIESLGKIL